MWGVRRQIDSIVPEKLPGTAWIVATAAQLAGCDIQGKPAVDERGQAWVHAFPRDNFVFNTGKGERPLGGGDSCFCAQKPVRVNHWEGAAAEQARRGEERIESGLERINPGAAPALR